MSARRVDLRIPIRKWDPAEYVPAAAQEAVVLADLLRGPSNSLDEVVVIGGTVPVEVTTAEIDAGLCCRSSEASFEVQASVTVVLKDSAEQDLATITVTATSAWTSIAPLSVQSDAADTFTLAFGCLEPISEVAKAIEGALATLRIESAVSVAETLEFNRRAVFEIAEQPAMDSDGASPLNPYAMAGIPGVEAASWERMGVPAATAAPWADRGLEAGHAAWWLQCGFNLDEALTWLEIGLDAIDARRFVNNGQMTALDVLRLEHDTGVSRFALVHLEGSVPRDRMKAWLQAIYEHEMLEPIDVQRLVAAGLTPGDLWGIAEGLTAGEIIAQFDEASDELEEIDDEGWDELDLAERD